MRTVCSALVCGGLLMGCSPQCGTASDVLEGPLWQVFGNVVVWETGPTGAPPGESPVNGYTDWAFEWVDPASPTLTVRIDDQPFDATGTWNPSECGNLALSFGGEYVGGTGTTHTFSAAGNFLVYDILFEGAVAWNETWQSFDGTVGTLRAQDASLAGRQYAP